MTTYKDERYERATMHFAGTGGDEGKQCASVEDMRREAIESAKSIMERQGGIIPTVFVYMPLETPNIAVLVLEDGFRGRGEKQRMGRNVAAFAARHGAAALCMCTDGYGVESPRGLSKAAIAGDVNAERELEKWTNAQYARYGALSNHPDRFEVLSINTIWPDGTCTTWGCRYTRVKVDGGAEIIQWGEIHDDWPVEGEGEDAKRGKSEQHIIPAWSKGAPQ